MRMSSHVKILFLSFFISTSLFAQGSLRGTVTDSLTSDNLVGANVFLSGTALGAASNIEGDFTINRIPAGNYIVKVSYIGYRTKEFPVTINDNKIVELDIALVPDIIEGIEVLITGQALGQVSAINQQRMSNTIINVVSEEKIKELPDANAAESIGRLPGVSILRSGGEANKVILRGLDAKFTNVTIDGVKIPPTEATDRGVDLSMISQSSLAGIELYKALTPDKDGDALAGTINLVTKKAPDQREIRVDLKGGYNNLMNSFEQYDFALNYGERFFNNVLGVQVFGNLENKIRSNERIDVDYAEGTIPGTSVINDFLLEFTDEIRKRNGVSLFLDLNTPDNGSIRFNNVYSGTKRDFFWSSRDYPVNGGGSQQGHPLYNFRDREQEITTFNSSLRGINHLFGFDFNWGVSFAQSKSFYPYDFELLFVEDGAGMINAPIDLTSNPEKLIPHAANNFSQANLDWAYYRSQNNFDKERTAFLDIAREYVIGNLLSGQIKIGGKYKIKDRENNRTEDLAAYYLSGRWMTHERLPDGTFRQKNFTGTYFEDWWRAGGGAISINEFFESQRTRNVYDAYLLNPLIDRERLRQWWDLNKYGVHQTGSTLPTAQEIWNNPLIEFDDYDIKESVSSAYIMNTLNIGQQLTIIGGVRIEREVNDYISRYMPGAVGGFPVTANSIRDTSSSLSQTVVLPNLNISYKPFEFLNIRLALYKTLTRPDFNMRLDRYIAGRPAEVGSQPQVYVGNANLKTAESWNYEINTSFYGNEIGLISVSAYYKEINNMYHMLNGFNTEAVRDNQGALQDTLIQFFGIKWPSQMGTTPYNVTLPYSSPEPTKVWGFEFEHQINFHFLPGLLQNIVLSYNASFVRSETVIYGSRTISFIDSSLIIPRQRTRNILVTSKQKLEGQPEFFGNISLGYDIGGFSGRISLFHKGVHNISFSASGRGDVETKPFTRIDLALKQQVTNFLSVYLNLNNLTNTEDAFNINRRLYSYTLFNESEKYGLTADLGVTVNL